MKPLIEIRNLNKVFRNEVLFRDFSMEIRRNEIIALMGPSGIGKSTLLNIIGQLDKDFTGMVAYDPVLFEDTRVPFPFVFQDADTLLPWKTVEGNIALVRKGITKAEMDSVLDTIALKDHRDKYPHELSGGMKQRVGIGRALVCRSKVMLMDEPFGSLDDEMRRRLQDFILELHRSTGITIVFVTHDWEEAERIATRIIEL